MNRSGQTPLSQARRRSAGPQGTRLFSTDDLRQYANEVESASERRASANEPVLERIGDGLAGRRFVLRSGRQTIGRREDNDLVIDEPSVSASHAWIINQHGHYVLMNTLSTNGTFVNDKRIHEVILRHGDHVRLGQAEFVFLTRERGVVAGGHLHWIAGGLLLILAGGFAWWLVG